MFGIRAVFLLSLVINVVVNGYQDDGNLDGELEVLLKRLQERLEDEERGYELEDLFDRESVSGIELDPDVLELFKQFKKTTCVYKWITLKIDQKRKTIVVDKTGVAKGIDEEAQFNEMKNELTSEPRYIFFKFRYISIRYGTPRESLDLIVWIDPDNSNNRDKLSYGTSTSSITKQCEGIGFVYEADDGHLDYKTILAKTQKQD